MSWFDGLNFVKITDHNRGPVQLTVERIETKSRMGDGTMRKYSVAKKRSWALTWTNIPSRTRFGALNTVDGGMDGSSMEEFHNAHDDEFDIKVLDGEGAEEIFTVMISDFSKDIVQRGISNDYWNLNITLEEV